MSRPKRVTLIVAMTRQGVIGRAGGLPWRLSADLKRFKALTMGHHLIMGRKTFESLGRVLPGRTSIVVTRQPNYALPKGVLRAANLTEALRLADRDDEAFVMGGGEVFSAALPIADRLHVTEVEADIPGDTWFPDWEPTHWLLISQERHSADENNKYDYTFYVYDRNWN